MSTRTGYLIGIIFFSLYLIFGLGRVVTGVLNSNDSAIKPKEVKAPEIPDIKTTLKTLTKVKIRKNLFGTMASDMRQSPRPVKEPPVEPVEPKTLSLKGIIVTPGGQFRAIIKPKDSRPVTVTTGQRIEGYLVQAITQTQVVLKKGTDTIRLTLYKKNSGEH